MMTKATAKAANIGGPVAPAGLRVLNGRGTRKDGRETDSGGRPVEEGPKFVRQAPLPPSHLSEDALWLWQQIAHQMGTLGILKAIDGASMEVLCETFARWRDAVRMRQASGMLAMNSQGQVTAPWVGIEERAGREFRAWCAEYGITPAAERNLIGKDPGTGGTEGNPF